MISPLCCPPRPHERERPEPPSRSRPSDSYTTSKDTTGNGVANASSSARSGRHSPRLRGSAALHPRSFEDGLPHQRNARCLATLIRSPAKKPGLRHLSEPIFSCGNRKHASFLEDRRTSGRSNCSACLGTWGWSRLKARLDTWVRRIRSSVSSARSCFAI
jgi:hypothetical protein